MSLEPTKNDVPAAVVCEADRPTKVVFFDGVCGLCNRFVNFILSRDSQATIRFAPLQGETSQRWGVASLVARQVQTEQPAAFETVVWFDREGRSFVRSAAVVRVLWELGGLWKIVGNLLWLIPRPLRDMGYRCVSASRYRLFGKREQCRLPTSSERSRFLP